jgi:hypothetical protein
MQCRSLSRTVLEISLVSNPLVYAGIALTLAMQVTFVSSAVMNAVFHRMLVASCGLYSTRL